MDHLPGNELRGGRRRLIGHVGMEARRTLTPPLRALHTVNTAAPDYLRLYRENRPGAEPDEVRSLWLELNQTFQSATGLSLEEASRLPQIVDNVKARPQKSTDSPSTIAPAVRDLGALIERLWNELNHAHEALRRGEAELATAVPLVARRHDQDQLAARLESVIRSGAEAIGCTSAGLYVLDSGTAQLKLRAMWNLPRTRLAEPSRALAGALADLEVMCGHAVVLDNPPSMGSWNVPEPCQAAACVPVASATTVMGTLWLFSDRPRSFSDAEVNIAEIVGGRMAAELERELLLAKGNETSKIEKQLELASRIQEHQVPQMPPLVDAWQVAGITDQLQILGGDFHDWLVRNDDQLVTAVGDCLDGGVDASLCTSAVRAVWRAIANDVRGPEEMLARINDQLWTGSSGDQYAHLFVAFADPTSGRLRYSAAGCPGALLLERDRWRSLIKPSLALGVDAERVFHAEELNLARGQSLVVMTNGVLDAVDQNDRTLDIERLAEWLLKHPQSSAGQMVDLVRDFLEAHYTGPRYDDRTILVLRRR